MDCHNRFANNLISKKVAKLPCGSFVGIAGIFATFPNIHGSQYHS